MNYQSSSNYFPIENPFINYFLWFYTALDWAQLLWSAGGSAQDILDSVHSKNGRRVDSLVSRGFFNKTASRRGMKPTRPSDRTWAFQIRSGVDRNGTRRPPHDQISTLLIQNARYTCHPSDLNRTARRRSGRTGILRGSLDLGSRIRI